MEKQKGRSQMEQIEQNKKWREKKFGHGKIEYIDEDTMLDEKEQRNIRNRKWREKRKSSRNATPAGEKSWTQ